MPIATTNGRVVIYLNRLVFMKLHDPLITWSCEIMWQTKIIIPILPEYLWTQNLVGYWITLGVLYPWSHCIDMWSCKVTWQTKIIKYPLNIQGGVPFHKSSNSLITWNVTKNILATVSLLPQNLCSLNLTRWWLTIRNFNSLSHTTVWTRGYMRSRDKLKTFRLYYLITYSLASGLHVMRSFLA